MKVFDKRQRVLLLGIFGVLVLLALLLFLHLMAPMDEPSRESVIGVIPEADLQAGEDSKTASYRKGNQIGAYWDSLEEPLPGTEREEVTQEPERDPRRPGAIGVEDLFGDCQETQPTGSLPVTSEKGGERKRQPSGGPSSKALPPPSTLQEDPVQPTEPSSPPTSESTENERPQVKRSGAVSSLDEDVTSDLGNGFSTLDGTDRWVGSETGKPYRCMFTRDEKVRSGQRITLRLLEDLVISGVHIPRNTHLQGLVTVSDRMEIRIGSLDMGGRILSFHFEAYDTDGGKGIYCSDLSQTGKTAAEQGLSTISSTLNSRLGRVARDAASVGASIIRSKSGEATVSVSAGYTFYIIEETR